MQQTEETPTFNMKAVVQETGLKPDTLRAWERRYGLPEPGRSEGGHRLYSQRDIDTLKWLMLRQQEGLSISHAVELYHRLEAEGQDPLLVRGQTIPISGTGVTAPIMTAGGQLDDLRQEWIKACMDFDEIRAEQAMAQAFALFPLERVCFDLLRAGLQEIGNGWYQGSVSVQQEHFASELAIRRLEAMVAISPRPTRSGRILVACPAGEEHTFGPLLITLILRRSGWDVTYLGANVPVSQLELTLSATRPNLVILSAQLLTTAATLKQTALMLREQNIPLAYGGRIFNLIPELQERILGQFLGAELEKTEQTVEQIMVGPFSWPHVKPVTPKYQALLSHFQNLRATIDGEVWSKLASQGFSLEQIQDANTFLSNNIRAALYLGDLEYLNAEIDWIYQLLANRELESSLLSTYLQVYEESITEHLNDRGQPLVRWLSQVEKNLN